MFRGLALVAVALLVTACGGTSLPPAASVAASAAAASALPAGTYTSSAFQPAVTFTLPDGWRIAGDSPKFFQLSPAGNDIDGIYLFRDVSAASQDPACPDAAEPGVGTTSTELIRWIRALPGLTVSNPNLAAIGTLPATSIDLGIKEGWKQSCSFANGSPTVPLFYGGTAGFRWIVYGDERMRLFITDVTGGGNLVVQIDTIDGPYIDQLIAQALPIVKSMTFATAPASQAPASTTP